MDQDPRTAETPIDETSETPPVGDPSSGSGGQDQRSPDEIRADIDDTRAQLGDTVEALAEKTDVKQQARQRVKEVKDAVTTKADELTSRAKQATPESAQQGGQQLMGKVRENPAQAAIAGAMVVAFMLGRLTKRRA